jgi:GntR family transcriptional regulator, transcriptional repressor for pyruvate dehydrogenase complex
VAKPRTKIPAAQKIKKTAVQGNGVHSNIFEELQKRIRQGDWLPGDRLPSITQLAKEMHVGAGSIREALRSLQSINLVKIEHGSGVYVTQTRPSVELTNPLQNTGDGLLLALAETRRILEPELAFLAAERGTDEELLEIEGLVVKMKEEFERGNNFVELDVLFHRQIAHAARNPVLYQMVISVRELWLELRKSIVLDPNTSVRSLRYHTLIAEALRSRNALQARLLMQGEMNSMLDDVLASEAIRKSVQKIRGL